MGLKKIGQQGNGALRAWRRITAGQPLLKVLVLASIGAAIYWGLVASDRFVSEAQVVVDRTDAVSMQVPDATALLTGATRNNDLMLLRDHLLSYDMLSKLDAQLDLRKHYSDWHRDPLARLWSSDVSIETLHDHYLSRVLVSVDEQSGVLKIQAQAYTPEMAHAITKALVEQGELFMNEMSHRLAREQVVFLEQQVDSLGKRVHEARQAMVAYQNEKRLISPTAAAESLSSVVGSIESQLATLRAQRQAKSGYLSPSAAEIVQLNLEIAALETQRRRADERMASPGGAALNLAVDEFQRLQQQAVFAQDIYQSALLTLEKGRIDAVRTIKKLSIVQHPTLPQKSLEPRRLYNTVVFSICAFLLAGIVYLLTMIIRDHID